MRNHYDDSYGVCSLTWELGEPSSYLARPVLVEVWRSRTVINSSEATKPQVLVEAELEMRVRVDSVWMVLGWHGNLTEAKPGEVRRHAYLRARSWSTTIVLDGWRN